MSTQTMSFSDQQTIQSCTEFLDQLEKPACNCNAGVRMCKHTPCIGTVNDLEKLIDAGYAKNLMLDWWVGEDSGHKAIKGIMGKNEESEEGEPVKLFKRKKEKLHRENPFIEDVPYLVPAVVGSEGQKAKFVKTGTCNLLVDNKCSIHHLNLKPVQGRIACCKINRVFKDENGKQQELDERIPVLHTWNSQRGKDLIKRWKEEVGFVEGEDDDIAPVPKNAVDLLETLFELLKSHADLYAEKQEGEEGQVCDDRPVKTVELTKPY